MRCPLEVVREYEVDVARAIALQVGRDDLAVDGWAWQTGTRDVEDLGIDVEDVVDRELHVGLLIVDRNANRAARDLEGGFVERVVRSVVDHAGVGVPGHPPRGS